MFSLIGMGLDKLGRSLSLPKETAAPLPIIIETNEFVVSKNENAENNVNRLSTSLSLSDQIKISNEKIEMGSSESDLTMEQSVRPRNQLT